MRIHFIGSGWLAQPAARHFQHHGHDVLVTTTHADKAHALQQAGLPALVYRLGEDLNESSALLGADVLVLAITSKAVDGYAQLMKQLATSGKEPHLIHISSTSVYANSPTPHSETSTELNEHNPLLRIEQLIQQHPQATIIRMAGLVGPGRHPGRFFAGGKIIQNPSAPVNLIHLADCIGIIDAVIQQHAWGQVFNGCADTHPEKGEFYPTMTAQLGLPRPQIGTASAAGSHKIIVNTKIKETLAYQLVHPDVMKFSY